MTDHRARVAETYRQQVAAAEHDEQCEFRLDGFYICHCSKRARIAEGYTEPPGELIWHAPSCPRCERDVWHDGDSLCCENCRCRWDQSGKTAEFFDDYGEDLSADVAKWDARPKNRV